MFFLETFSLTHLLRKERAIVYSEAEWSPVLVSVVLSSDVDVELSSDVDVELSRDVDVELSSDVDIELSGDVSPSSDVSVDPDAIAPCEIGFFGTVTPA
eukprot:CAMPEP_0184413272 /NCGR_PEP_ID=MMETSP0738-20130409/7126_1 /TAXON_ID=385413 /ORGANISM="Thalassiosira miniscula, Strain CCMP1093" /LENGTH=98 /DNA_ID=CAMNT_0026771997 /DNA_START=165 /DNA_END=457 /DNA_ORIENTATION=+